MTPEQLRALAARVDALSLSDQLRLAAGLIEGKQPETARVLIQRVDDALHLAEILEPSRRRN